jgi:hypothetical protein
LRELSVNGVLRHGFKWPLDFHRETVRASSEEFLANRFCCQ